MTEPREKVGGLFPFIPHETPKKKPRKVYRGTRGTTPMVQFETTSGIRGKAPETSVERLKAIAKRRDLTIKFYYDRPPSYTPPGRGSFRGDMPEMLGGKSRRWYEPSVEQFLREEGERYAKKGVDLTQVDETHPKYIDYANRKWAEEYDQAVKDGVKIVRHSQESPSGTGEMLASAAAEIFKPMAAATLGAERGLTGGVAQEALGYAAEKATGEPTVERLRSVQEKHPFAAGAGMMAGVLNPNSLAALSARGITRATGATGRLGGALAGAGGAMIEGGVEDVTRGASDIGRGEEPLTLDPDRLKQANLIRAGLGGVFGGAFGKLPSKASGLRTGQLRGYIQPAEEVGGKTTFWSGFEVSPAVEANIQKAARVAGETPVGVASKKIAGRLEKTASALKGKTDRELRELAEAYEASPQGQSYHGLMEVTEEAWDIAQKALYTKKSVMYEGKPMPLLRLPEFQGILKSSSDLDFVARDLDDKPITKALGLRARVPRESFTVSLKEAEDILGREYVRKQAKDYMRRELGGPRDEKGKILPIERVLDIDNVIITPRKVNAAELERLVGAIDDAAEFIKTGKPDPLFTRLSRSAKSVRTKFGSNEVAPDSLTATAKIRGKTVELKGYAALKKIEGAKKKKVAELLESASLPREIGESLSPNEQKAFYNALRNFQRGEGRQTADPALRKLAKLAGVTKELKEISGTNAGLEVLRAAELLTTQRAVARPGSEMHAFMSISLGTPISMRVDALKRYAQNIADAVGELPGVQALLVAMRKAGPRKPRVPAGEVPVTAVAPGGQIGARSGQVGYRLYEDLTNLAELIKAHKPDVEMPDIPEEKKEEIFDKTNKTYMVKNGRR